MGSIANDPVWVRQEAIRLISEVLDEKLRTLLEVRRQWPAAGHGDALVTKAFLEVQHYFIVKTTRQRRVLELVRTFLEEGGTPSEFETAYGKIVRECRGEALGPD